jgi:hypothetical protein
MPSTTTFTYGTVGFSAQAGEYREESTITERRHLERNDGTAFDILKDTVLAEVEGALPRRGDPALGSGTGVTWQQFARFRGYTVEQLPNASGAMFTLTWSTMYVLSEPSTYYTIGESVEFQSINRSMRIYRTGWSTNPPAASDASADIGGTATQGLGDSNVWPVNQCRIRMRFIQDATAVQIVTSAANLSNYNNTRNSATFLGCAARSLICEGVTFNPVKHEFYEVTFDFLFCPFFHHEQVPDLAPDGRPDRVSTGPKTVKWKRLPRTETDFNDIYGGSTALKAIVERGYPIP